jgi:SPP1 gp7 family putative phage head morphogenesis protein
MVDVKVFEDQLKEKHLDAKTEARIRKLLKNSKIITEKQALILQGIIDGYISNINKATTLEQLAITTNINPFITTAGAEAMIGWQANIGKIFNMGIKFSNKEMSKTVRLLEDGVKQSTMTWITKLGDDMKTRAGEIVADGLSKSIPVNDVVANLEKELGITRARANSIARTETMRAAHAGSYAQAIRDGKNYYIIDSRAEACKICKKKFTDEVFDITDPGPMPPAHPNCACIPLYFDTFEEAVRWATKISNDIDNQVKQLEDKGLKIKPDGTGAEVNKMSPDRRLKN